MQTPPISGIPQTEEALLAAGAAVWSWSAASRRLTLKGAYEALGLEADCSLVGLTALALPQDRDQLQSLNRPGPGGSDIVFRLRLRSGETGVWRGAWLEGGDAMGVVSRDIAIAPRGDDPLTGLLSRAAFLERARSTIQGERPWRLISADLARFSRLNEALGHERADLVLSALGARLANAFPADAVGRIGEDEFAILAPDEGDPLTGFREVLERPIRVAGFEIYPAFAIGSAPIAGGQDAPDAAEMLRRTELAVEQAKREGRASAHYGRDMESDVLSRLSLEADLRFALERGEIEPFFQPVVRLDTGKLAGFEALARWRHPKRGVLAPESFLHLIGEAGLMVALGRRMIDTATDYLSAWRKTHGVDADDLFVSVNLSSGEMDREDLPNEVADVLSRTRLPAGTLKLELTEGEAMRNPDKAWRVMSALREIGAGVALDDFGMGFSSLSYLSRLPIETLKIDRCFVASLNSDEASAKIVRAVAGLGRELGLEIVAEGVEDIGAAQRLRALGCGYGQGYGYAQPLPANDAETYLSDAASGAQLLA
jgi:c-di-GMP-specific phosphodiesterase